MCAAGLCSTSGLPLARGTASISLLQAAAASIGALLSHAGACRQGGLKLGLAALPRQVCRGPDFLGEGSAEQALCF